MDTTARASKVVFASKGKSVHQNPSKVYNADKSVSRLTQNTKIFASKGKSLIGPMGRKEDSSEAASNLRAFRRLFGDDDEEIEEKDEFLGFRRDDEIFKTCQLIRARLAEEINLLEKQARKSKLQSKRKLASLTNIQKKVKVGDLSSEAEETVKSDSVVPSSSNTCIGARNSSADSNVPHSLGRKASDSLHLQVPQKMPGKVNESRAVANTEDVNQSHKLNTKKAVPTTTRVNNNRKIIPQSSTNVSRKQPQALTSVPSPSTIANNNFNGFSLDSPLRVACKLKLDKIIAAVERHDDFLGFPPDHPLRRKCIMKLEKITSELSNENNFLGFSVDDPLRQACIGKYRSIAVELTELIETVKEKRSLLLHTNPTNAMRSARRTRKPSAGLIESVNLREKGRLEMETDCKPEFSHFSETSIPVQEEENASTCGNIISNDEDSDGGMDSALVDPGMKKQVKVLIPNVKANMSVVKKGPRIKNVRFFGGAGQKLPLSKFLPHQYPWNQSYDEPGLSGEFADHKSTGASTKELLVDLSSEPDIQAEAEEEMLLDRQRGTNGPRKGLIKAIIPFSVNEIVDSGFPVISTGPFPPKPLCFLCGSAGIEQVL